MYLPRIRVGAGIVLSLCLLASTRVSARSIGVFGDASASTCNITWNTAVSFQSTIYLFALLGDIPGISAVEFRLAGLPTLQIPPQMNIPDGAFSLGTIHDGIFVILSASGICQTPGPSRLVLIGTVTLISFDPVGEHTLSILADVTPSNPAFNCPQVQLCDNPAFTRVCVAGGQAFLNSSTDCTVAVRAMTWSQIKHLYN